MKKLTSAFLEGYLKELKVCKESREVILQTLSKERIHYPSCNHDLLLDLILEDLHYYHPTYAKEEVIMWRYKYVCNTVKSFSLG